jgi:hypothetical protein
MLPKRNVDDRTDVWSERRFRPMQDVLTTARMKDASTAPFVRWGGGWRLGRGSKGGPVSRRSRQTHGLLAIHSLVALRLFPFGRGVRFLVIVARETTRSLIDETGEVVVGHLVVIVLCVVVSQIQLLIAINFQKIYPSQTKILEGRTNISERIFEALFKGEST